MCFRLLRGGVFPYGNNQESQHATDSDQETTDDEFHVRLLSVLNRYFRLPQEWNNPYTPLEVATAVPYAPEKAPPPIPPNLLRISALAERSDKNGCRYPWAPRACIGFHSPRIRLDNGAAAMQKEDLMSAGVLRIVSRGDEAFAPPTVCPSPVL